MSDNSALLQSGDSFARRRVADIDARISLLGISALEMTPAVKLAVSALLENLDDTTHELERTKETLAEMQRLVDVDCVASIPNRRAFMRRLNWAINMLHRYHHPSTLLYFDLNDFKRINDSYGHAAGDAAILHVVSILTKATRDSDFLARIGGDEFAIILYHSDERNGQLRGASIIKKLQEMPYEFNQEKITVTSALGVYGIREGDNAEQCLAQADMNMYNDKRMRKL